VPEPNKYSSYKLENLEAFLKSIVLGGLLVIVREGLIRTFWHLFEVRLSDETDPLFFEFCSLFLVLCTSSLMPCSRSTKLKVQSSKALKSFQRGVGSLGLAIRIQ